jgi:hypothetical protein
LAQPRAKTWLGALFLDAQNDDTATVFNWPDVGGKRVAWFGIRPLPSGRREGGRGDAGGAHFWLWMQKRRGGKCFATRAL